jgi:Rps23 Pro-64 3,4-dihydroxylase Tpa1-like proline 4-hydroxylase
VLQPGEIPQSYGLSRSLTEGVPSFTYQASAGDLVIFNTRNPHEVASGTANTAGSRVSIGSFAGRKPNGSLVLWA